VTDLASITLRMDPTMKAQIETIAAASDRTPTEWVYHQIRRALAMQCEHCGHVVGGAPVLPFGATAMFQDWMRDSRAAKETNQYYVTCIENGRNTVYFGEHRFNIEPVGSLPFNAFIGLRQNLTQERFPMAIPFGTITGVGWDNADGREYVRLLRAGYVDGNEPLRRYLAASLGPL
jgi:hypothetical protein